MRAFKIAVSAAVVCLVFNVAHAGKYDFDYKRLNDMRKAFMMCKTSQYQDGECPDVWEKCHQHPLIDWDGDSKCQKAPKFTNKNDDAQEALRDGNDMAGDGTIDGDQSETETDYTAASTEAYALDESSTMQSEDPCAAAADQRACAEALVVDAGGVVAYEADAGAISEDKTVAAQLATESGQPAIATVLGVQTTTPVTEDDVVGDDSYLDETGSYEGYSDYAAEYGLPSLEEESAASEGESAGAAT